MGVPAAYFIIFSPSYFHLIYKSTKYAKWFCFSSYIDLLNIYKLVINDDGNRQRSTKPFGSGEQNGFTQ